MRIISTFFFIIILLCSCNSFKKNAELTDFIPENTSVIINTNTLDDVISSCNENPIVVSIANGKDNETVGKQLSNLKQFSNSSPILLCLSKNNTNLEYTFITTYDNVEFLTDSITKSKTKTINLENAIAFETTFNETALYSIVRDSIVISSTDKNYLSNVVLGKNTADNTLQKMAAMPKNNTLPNIIVNTKKDTIVKSIFKNSAIPFDDFANYISFDTDVSQNAIELNGIAKSTDSTKSFINCFKHTIPQENRAAVITPSNADSFLSVTFDDFEVFNNNLKAFKLSDSLQENNDTSLFENINEIITINSGSNQTIALHSIDNIATKDALASEQQKVETYRGVTLFKFSKPTFFNNLLSPIATLNEAKLYFNIENFFVFTKTKDEAYNIIANYQNKTTLNTKTYYSKLKEELSDESSLLQVVSPKALKQLLQHNSNTDVKQDLDNYKASAIQFIYDTNFAHVNAVIKKERKRSYQNSVTEKFSIKLDADVLNTPQFVTNYKNKTKDILVQDVKNKLYLISNSGRIIWKKQLNGPILGKIEQIDIFKNGRLQFLFTTPYRVYLIPRSGKKVKPFPLKFKDKITQPLSVFDYDKKRNYRILVTQGKNVLMYNSKGKIVKGFKFKAAKGTIIAQPKHFKIRRKDYIVLKTSDYLHILSRTGETLIKPKTSVKFSNQPVFLNRGVITTSTDKGDIFRIDHKGGININRHKLSSKHYLDASSKTYTTLSGNKLSINNRPIELDFGQYTKPKIFYIKNKIYVALTDLQAQKAHLFNSLGKPIDNFPVYSNSEIDLSNIDRDRNLEFVTKGDNNTILLYEIN